MRANFKMQRLFVDEALSEGAPIEASKDQAHYLATVLRLGEGAELLLFNGRDGEWKARLAFHSKKRSFSKRSKGRAPSRPPPTSSISSLR